MERVHRWVEGQLGTSVTLAEVGHPDGEAAVWRVDDRGRATAYLKVHRVSDKWRRERAILQRLHETPGPVPTPRVLGAEPELLALLLLALPGRPATEDTWTLRQWCSLHEQAGRLRRHLDAIAVDEADSIPLPEALRRRHRTWSERARGHLDDAALAAIEAAFHPDALADVPRRWCHRDLTPSNWIVQSTTAGLHMGVIDFGQARPDAWLADVVKLWSSPWREDPTLAESFWRGYGRLPSAPERDAIRQLALLHGLATATWGDRHGHAELSAEGRRVLQRALRGPTAPPRG